MRYVRLSCFDGFTCTAAACPDTCCAGWEIDLDERILAVYAALGGALGQEVRSCIAREDGYVFFRCREGRCPFLRDDGLCRLILARDGAQDLLSEVCREHPRFHEHYGSLRETALAISCPEAARLLIESGPVELLTETEDPESPESPKKPEDEEDGPDRALLALLLEARARMLGLVQSPVPIADCLRRLTVEAWKLQARIDNPGLSEKAAEAAWLKAGRPGMEDAAELRPWLMTMLRMEFTDDRLRLRLKAALSEAGALRPEFLTECDVQYRNLLVYFLYRYLLRAVWDEDAVGKVGLAVRLTETIALLAEQAAAEEGPEGGKAESRKKALIGAAVPVSRETEHSDENLELLYDAVWVERFPEEGQAPS